MQRKSPFAGSVGLDVSPDEREILETQVFEQGRCHEMGCVVVVVAPSVVGTKLALLSVDEVVNHEYGIFNKDTPS